MTTAQSASRHSPPPRVASPRPALPAPPVGPKPASRSWSGLDWSPAQAIVNGRRWVVDNRLRVEKYAAVAVLALLLGATLVLLAFQWLQSGTSPSASGGPLAASVPFSPPQTT